MLFAIVLPAQDDPHELLKKIGRSVAGTISKSDNYICAQDLSRFYYSISKAAAACQQPPVVPVTTPRVQDRLKLDVAVSQGVEIYSWHGEHKFSGTNIGELVREGPISSGSFSGYLRNIFGESNVKFVFRGESNVDTVSVYDFDYAVPLTASHYRLQAGAGYVLAPFHGSFSARVDNFQLYSLTVTADGGQIPPRSDICSAQSRVTYQIVKMASHESLLPATFDLLLGTRSGVFTRSKGGYSECHEYTGESTVHFDMDEAATNTAPTELETMPIKPGIFLPIALRGQIDEDTAYAGLPVEAVLSQNVKLKKGVMLARGSMLKGTVTHFQIFHEPAHQVALGIEFSSITDGRKLYLCSAVHDVPLQFIAPPAQGRFGSTRRWNSTDDTRMPEGEMMFNTSHLHLDNTFTSLFVTVSHSQIEAQ